MGDRTAGSAAGAFRDAWRMDTVTTVLVEHRFVIGNEGHYLVEFKSNLVYKDWPMIMQIVSQQ